MRQHFIILATIIAFLTAGITSCHRAIYEEIDSLQQRISALETAQRALEKNLSITSIDNLENGYVLHFSDGTSVQIINGGDSQNSQEGKNYIERIEIGDMSVVFYLKDGTSFEIPLYSALSISFNQLSNIVVAPKSTIEIPFSWTSNLDPVTVESLSSSDIQCKVETIPSSKSGVLTIQFSDSITEYSKVIVLASNGVKVVFYTLSFDEAAIQITSPNSLSFPASGGSQDISFLTNVGYSVEIPQESSSWLQYTPTKGLTEHSGTLTVMANTSYESRSSFVRIADKDLNLSAEITILQSGKDGLALLTSEAIVMKKGGELIVPFKATDSYVIDVTDGSDWISLIETKSMTERESTFSVSPNNQVNPREGKIVYSSPSEEETQVFRVRQFGRSYAMSIVSENHTLDFLEATQIEGMAAIDWGDGIIEDYTPKASHSYETVGPHKMCVIFSQYEDISFANLKGISSIDLSEVYK